MIRFTLVILLFLIPEISEAATEYATFEAFYQGSSMIGWIAALVVAIIAGLVIFFTGGTASPIVVSIGTWIGGLMGLSGIAATNAGLALLGGGAIASGGFGIVGGTALLTAAMTFGTDIVFDYTLNKGLSEYNYSQLRDQSKNMTSLPLPVNESGSDAYEKAMTRLEKVVIDQDHPIFSDENQKIIRETIEYLLFDTKYSRTKESAKDESLLSLLYFLTIDYKLSKDHAIQAIRYARSSDIRRTLPAFLLSASSVYDEDFDFNSVTNEYFQYSVLAEPKNPLIPFMFSIYLDRVMLRFNDNYLDEETFIDIFSIMKNESLRDFQLQNYVALLARYFVRLKLEQQKIASLATSTNKAIKISPKTIVVLEDSLLRYAKLLDGAGRVMKEVLGLKSGIDDENRKQVANFHELLLNYLNDKNRLSTLVTAFKNQQLKNSSSLNGISHKVDSEDSS